VKRNILRLLGVGVILWGAGIYAVNNAGVASCVPATGLSGLVHKALFAPTATCQVTRNGNVVACASPGAVCNISNNLSGVGASGHCVAQNNSCQCVKNTP
jgi:hypothetical protein